MGTCNNPQMSGEDFLRAVSEVKGVAFTCGQLESGVEGTEHIQFYVNLEQPQAISFMKKVCPRSHWELCRSTAASEKYVLKEDTRVAGPWEFGKRPIEKQNKHDVEMQRQQRAEDNKKILEAGPVKAIEEGMVDITKFWQLKRSLDLYQLATKEPFTASDCRGIWIYGPAGTGKTHRARTRYGQAYLKPQNKWWDGY